MKINLSLWTVAEFCNDVTILTKKLLHHRNDDSKKVFMLKFVTHVIVNVSSHQTVHQSP